MFDQNISSKVISLPESRGEKPIFFLPLVIFIFKEKEVN